MTATDAEDPLSNSSAIEKTEVFESRLMNSFDDNELISAAEKYLLNMQRGIYGTVMWICARTHA